MVYGAIEAGASPRESLDEGVGRGRATCRKESLFRDGLSPGSREGGGAVGITLDLIHRVTDQELRALSERNPGYQFERTARGELMVSPTGSEAGRRNMELAFQLQAWSRQNSRGVAFDSSTGFNLPDGSCLSPDASWITGEVWTALSPSARQGFAPVCPDAVFEVRSRSNTPMELRGKMHSYLANGARLAVLIDPDTRTVEVYRPELPPQVYAAAVRVPLDPELPGFMLDLVPLFEG